MSTTSETRYCVEFLTEHMLAMEQRTEEPPALPTERRILRTRQKWDGDQVTVAILGVRDKVIVQLMGWQARFPASAT